MKLHLPNPDERFVVLIDDADGDDTEILFFKTRELADAHVVAQYGNEYLDKERPNVRIHIAEVLARTTL